MEPTDQLDAANRRLPDSRVKRLAKRRSASQPLSFSSQILAFQSLPRSSELAAVGSGGAIWGGRRDNFRDSRFDEDTCLTCQRRPFAQRLQTQHGRPPGPPPKDRASPCADHQRRGGAGRGRCGGHQPLLDRVEAIEGTQGGLADVKAGRTNPRGRCWSAAPQAWHTALRLRGTLRPISRSSTCGGRAGVPAGRQWFDGLEQAVLSLDQHPKRCPIAPEGKDRRLNIRPSSLATPCW